nr:conserved hypothetical protein [Vibrio chagasii]
MDANQILFNCRHAVENGVNPKAETKIGVVVEPLHPNAGIKGFCCNVQKCIPTLTTTSSVSFEKIGSINATVSTDLRETAELMQKQIDEMSVIKNELLKQADMIDSGKVDIDAMAEQQLQANYSDHKYNIS